MYAGHFDFEQPMLWTVPNLYTAKECAALLALGEGQEWLQGTVNSVEGRVVDTRIRDNSTAIFRDPGLAQTLFERVRGHLPAQMSADWGRGRERVAACGVHVPLRIYRYHPGQRFGLHGDQSYEREDGARSLLTLLVYLNDGFTGGETDFPEEQRRVVPVTGQALLFQHMVLHEGLPVLEGTKYVLRTDVLYERPHTLPITGQGRS